jgi:hypothetical protein
VGLDISDNDQEIAKVGDGDGDTGDGDTGDGDVGDGDIGDGDLSMGGASGGTDGAGGSDTASGGLDGSGGLLGTGGVTNTWEPLLLHTYENGMLPGETSTSNGELFVQDEAAHGGLYSLVASVPSASDASVTMTFDLSEHALTKVYLRAWVFVAGDSLTGWMTLFSFSSGEDSLDYGIDAEGRTQVGLANGSTTYASATGFFETGTWFCYRADAVINDQDGSVVVRVGNETSLTTPGGDTRPGEGILSFTYGIIEQGDGQAGGTVYFDDVAVDDQPIGCDMSPPIPVDPPILEPN